MLTLSAMIILSNFDLQMICILGSFLKNLRLLLMVRSLLKSVIPNNN